jgi:hypothetical protein
MLPGVLERDMLVFYFKVKIGTGIVGFHFYHVFFRFRGIKPYVPLFPRLPVKPFVRTHFRGSPGPGKQPLIAVVIKGDVLNPVEGSGKKIFSYFDRLDTAAMAKEP